MAVNGFQPYAAGGKRYGITGRSAPNVGPVNSLGGYATRDKIADARKRLTMQRLKQQKQQGGNYSS